MFHGARERLCLAHPLLTTQSRAIVSSLCRRQVAEVTIVPWQALKLKVVPYGEFWVQPLIRSSPNGDFGASLDSDISDALEASTIY